MWYAVSHNSLIQILIEAHTKKKWLFKTTTTMIRIFFVISKLFFFWAWICLFDKNRDIFFKKQKKIICTFDERSVVWYMYQSSPFDVFQLQMAELYFGFRLKVSRCIQNLGEFFFFVECHKFFGYIFNLIKIESKLANISF